MARGRPSIDDADVVVLNTCCIRENADNKLYGTPRPPQVASRTARPDLADRGRRLPGPEGPRAHPGSGPPTSTWCSAPTTSHRAVELLHAARADGPVTEIWEADGARRGRGLPVGPAGPPGDRLRRLGHHPDRLRQLLRLLHRARGAGPGDQPAVRRAGGRGRAPGRRRRGRGHPARPERQLLRPRPDHPAAGRARLAPRDVDGGRRRRGPATDRPRARPLFADLLRRRRPRSRASGGSATPARTRRTCGPRRSRPWPPSRRSARTCTCRCSPAATGSWPPCTAATPPSATSSGWPRPGPPIDDLAVTTDIIVGFPGETDDDFERTLEVVAEAAYDSAYTFIYSPRPGTEAAERADAVRRPPRSWPSASSGCGSWSSAQRPGPPPGPGRAGRGGPGRGPEQEGPGRR